MGFGSAKVIIIITNLLMRVTIDVVFLASNLAYPVHFRSLGRSVIKRGETQTDSEPFTFSRPEFLNEKLLYSEHCYALLPALEPSFKCFIALGFAVLSFLEILWVKQGPGWKDTLVIGFATFSLCFFLP